MPEETSRYRSTLAQSWPVRIVRHALEAAVAIVVASYAVIICTQVFYRYVLNSSLIWSEELVRFGLLWGVMLGAGLASDRNAHIAIDPLRDFVRPSAYRIISFCSSLLILVFCAIVAWYGWEYSYRIRFMTSPASQIPMMYVYAAIPVGCLLMAFFCIVHLVSGTYVYKQPAEKDLLT